MFLRTAVLATALALSSCASPLPEATHRHPPFLMTAWSAGESMLPTFALVEIVHVEPCSYTSLKIGDTVIYWNEKLQTFAHHRIVGQQGPWFVVQGDNRKTNPRPDTGFLTADNFVGRTHKIP